MARRLLYFPMLVNEIKRHFGSISRAAIESETILSLSQSSSCASFPSSQSSQNISPQTPQNWWFTFKFQEQDCLIPLHLPTGLIYDLLNDLVLPWKLEFHISHQEPENTNQSLLNPTLNYFALLDESSLTSFYFSALKESDHLRSGSAKNVMNLSRAEQLQLWEALKSGEVDKFWRINQKLVTGNSFKSFPIKFWIFDEGTLTRFQFPIQPQPQISTLEQLLTIEFSDSFVNRVKSVCAHGISLPLNTKLDELNYNWNYADNFINIIIHLNK